LLASPGYCRPTAGAVAAVDTRSRGATSIVVRGGGRRVVLGTYRGYPARAVPSSAPRGRRHRESRPRHALIKPSRRIGDGGGVRHGYCRYKT